MQKEKVKVLYANNVPHGIQGMYIAEINAIVLNDSIDESIQSKVIKKIKKRVDKEFLRSLKSRT